MAKSSEVGLDDEPIVFRTFPLEWVAWGHIMALRLGDLLVQHGVITEQQVEQALRNQQIYGGRLGTNLVELGFVSETKLASILSEQLKIPCAEAREFDSIAPEALEAISMDVAEKHKIVPLALTGRQLRIAMSDPTDLRALDELSFSMGLSIRPVIAPEILVTYALERYYGIPRGTRYLRVSGAAEPELEVIHVASWQDQQGEAALSNLKVEDRSQFLQSGRADLAEKAYTLEQAAKTLAAASDHDDVFDVMGKYMAQHFEKAAVFLLRGELVVAWKEVGCDVGLTDLRRISVPLAESELFGGVCRAKVPFVGTPVGSQVDRSLFAQLNLPPRCEALCMAVLVNNRPFSVLLGVNPRAGEAADLIGVYDTLVKKVSYAVQMLFLRRRILAS